jgi:hypothetical protein
VRDSCSAVRAATFGFRAMNSQWNPKATSHVWGFLLF